MFLLLSCKGKICHKKIMTPLAHVIAIHASFKSLAKYTYWHAENKSGQDALYTFPQILRHWRTLKIHCLENLYMKDEV